MEIFPDGAVTFPDGTRVVARDVIILARLSRKSKRHVQTGILTQDIRARDQISGEGFNIVATVPDHASGTKPVSQRKNARPWVTQPELMTKYQMIVASKHDRLTRADWRDEGDIRRWAEDNHKILYLTVQDLRWPPRNADDRQRWNNAAEQSRREWESSSDRYKDMQQYRRQNNYLVGRPTYGYRVVGEDCGKSPCRCYELDEIEDFKTLQIYEPEAKYVRGAKDRYLAGEALLDICEDFNARGIPSPMWRGKPGKCWYPKTLANLLRNPGIAGERQNAAEKTILRYTGIITWQEHEALVARLDSRAYRKGISPANVWMLNRVLFDEAGHAMYASKGGRSGTALHYRCRSKKRCGVVIGVRAVEAEVSDAVVEMYGHLPHMIQRIVPGGNLFEEIHIKRQERTELDDQIDQAGDPTPYQKRRDELTAEIRRLIKEDQEHPQADTVIWVESGKTIKEYWETLTNAGRRDWLLENGWKITAIKDDEMPDGWRLTFDHGRTAEIEAQALGFPVREFFQELADLPKTLGITTTE